MGEPPRSPFAHHALVLRAPLPCLPLSSAQQYFRTSSGCQALCSALELQTGSPRSMWAHRASQSCDHSDDCPSTSPEGELFPPVLVRALVPSQPDEGPGPIGLCFRASVSTSVTWAAHSPPPRSANEVVEGTVSGTEPGFLRCSKFGGSSALLPLPPASSTHTHPASCPVPGSWLL